MKYQYPYRLKERKLARTVEYIRVVRKDIQTYNCRIERLVNRLLILERKRVALVLQIEKEKDKNA